ncbi:MAG: hypothetical protein GY746_07625, partial [Gammaproteobacteria bacterium]|nr:hypothetical protein [Gammaproteobacteria bacterium]
MAERSGGFAGFGFNHEFNVTEVDRVGIEGQTEISAGYGQGVWGVAFSYDPANKSWSVTGSYLGVAVELTESSITVGGGGVIGKGTFAKAIVGYKYDWDEKTATLVAKIEVSAYAASTAGKWTKEEHYKGVTTISPEGIDSSKFAYAKDVSSGTLGDWPGKLNPEKAYVAWGYETTALDRIGDRMTPAKQAALDRAKALEDISFAVRDLDLSPDTTNPGDAFGPPGRGLQEKSGI